MGHRSIGQKSRLEQWRRFRRKFNRWLGVVVWLLGASLCLNAQVIQVLPDLAPTAASTDSSGPGAYKKMSLEELMDQEVTSVSKEPEPYGQAPAAIQIITNEDIRRSGASSIPEALQLAPNLDVAQKNSHDWGISARGFNTDLANKLLVLIDGRAVYSPLDAGVFWDIQNVMLEDLDRIEVVSGPGGTLWGANAVNGVINIVTKSAEETQGWFVDGGVGTELNDFGDVRYGGKLAPNVYFRVYGSYFDRGSEALANGKSASDSWSQGRGGFRIDTDGPSDDKFTLQGDYYNGVDHEPPPLMGKTAVNTGGNVLGRWTHTFSTDSNMSLQLYYDRTNLSDPQAANMLTPTFAPAGTLTDSLDTYDLNFQHSLRANDSNNFVWGLGYRFTHDNVGNAPATAFFPTVLNENVFSAFVQDEIQLQKDLILTLGTKVEHNDYTRFEVEPSGRLQWNVTPKQMLWAAVSRAVRTPSRIDHDFENTTGFAPIPSVLNGSSTFVSETLIAYELGYRAQLNSQLSTSVSTFYNDYTDLRSAAPTSGPFGLPFIFQNNLKAETYGAEVSATYQVLDWWRLRAGYDLLKEHVHVRPGEVDINHGLNETSDPEQQWSLRSSMDLPQNIEFDTGLRWVDTLHTHSGAVPQTVPSYYELEARLGWHPTKDLEISLVGQNLLHDQHPEYGVPSPTQVEIERSVYGKIAWHF